jgi:hypothetical protein
MAKAETNLLGEKISQVYRIKISGIWTVDNLASLSSELAQLFGESLFDVEFECERVTKYLDEQRGAEG